MRFCQRQIVTPKGLAFLREPFHPGVHRHELVSTPPSTEFGPAGSDRVLGANEEPPLGAHLVTPRFAYAHHGIYVGGGAVVHYRAFACEWRRGPVEEISLARFAHGHPVRVRAPRVRGLPPADIVDRARSRLGEDRYRFFSNNCEHLSEWCVNGEHRSPQVERLLARFTGPVGVWSELRRWLTSRPLRAGECGYPRPTR